MQHELKDVLVRGVPVISRSSVLIKLAVPLLRVAEVAVRDIGCYQDPGCAEKSEDHGVALYVVGSLCSGVDLK